MARNLDLDLIRTYVTVADCGSMTVAANLLHMTQGAVSQQMKRLEGLLARPLFVRKARKLDLSREGEQFLVKARHLPTPARQGRSGGAGVRPLPARSDVERSGDAHATR